MAEKRARIDLARAAARLAVRHTLALPSLVLMTDDARLADPLAAARDLPRGSMVVVRSRDVARRAELAAKMMEIARTRYLIVLIADDPALASRVGADGLHLPEAHMGGAAHWRALYPRWLITAALHRLPSCVPAEIDAFFLSAVFATGSHAGRTSLGPVRAGMMALQLQRPVYALGGIGARNASRLPPAFVGIAAVGALAV